MDNPRLLLWIGLALLAWMNIIQWDRDYGAQATAAATTARRAPSPPAAATQQRRRRRACRRCRPRRDTRRHRPLRPGAPARQPHPRDGSGRRQRERADGARRHRRARHGHQPAGRRPAARRPAAVPARQEAGQPARAPADHRRCDVRHRAQRLACGRRARRTDAPGAVSRPRPREYRLAPGASTNCACRSRGRTGRASP